MTENTKQGTSIPERARKLWQWYWPWKENRKAAYMHGGITLACCILLAVILIAIFGGKNNETPTLNVPETTTTAQTTAETTAETTVATTTAETTPAVTQAVTTKNPNPVIAKAPAIKWGDTRDVATLRSRNGDCIGYIQVPNTHMDYPVLQTPSDVQYYMYRSFGKVKNKEGSIFADGRAPITATSTPDNTVLYGHNMANDSMFADVHLYKDVNFYKKSPLAYFNSIAGNGVYKIFALFLADAQTGSDGYGKYRGATDFELNYYNKHSFTSADDFNAYYNDIMLRSMFTTGVDVKYGDKLLMLSTCGSDTRDLTNSRLVLVARKVRDGESTDVDVGAASMNPKVQMPKAWYAIHK